MVYYKDKNLLTSIFGFTLIELLVVVSVIGVVSAITVVTVNGQRQQQIARDGISRERIQKVSEVVESFRVLEGEYPVECPPSGTDPTPPTECNGALGELMDIWPAEIAYVAPTGEDFAIYTPSLVHENTYFKYSSDFTSVALDDASVEECGDQDISAVGGCSDPGTAGVPVPPATLTAVVVSPTSPAPSVAVGSTITFTVSGLYSDGVTRDLSGPVTWSSSNGNATVGSTGVARGEMVGTANIIATTVVGSTTYTGRSTLTITAASEPPSTATITITPTSGTTTIPVGSSAGLRACYSLDGGPCSDITLSADSEWTSSDTRIISVTRNIISVNVTGVSQGTADVVLTYRGTVGRLAITVTQLIPSRALDRVIISPDPVRLTVESTQQLTATAYFTDGTSSNVTSTSAWTNTTLSRAIILSTTGLVTGREVGEAVVQAAYTSGGVTRSDTVNVSVTSPSISCRSDIDCNSFLCPSGLRQVCNTFTQTCYCPN